MALKIIGIWLILDGAGSILNKRQRHSTGLGMGRIARIIIGVFLFLEGG